jgi:hypothetical protein
MGISDWLGIGKTIAEPIDAVSNLYTTNKARLEAERNLQEVIQKPQLAQIENNRLLSLSSNFFTSAWQPLIGWGAGFLVLLYYTPQLVIASYVWGYACVQTGTVTPFPIKPDDILNLVWLLFGFGGYSLAKRIK